MQQTMVHCPACQARLTIPETAAGHKVKCARCTKTFKVPEAKDMVDDTVSCWLEIEEEEQERIAEDERLMKKVAPSNPLLYDDDLDDFDIDEFNNLEEPSEVAASVKSAEKAPPPQATDDTSDDDDFSTDLDSFEIDDIDISGSNGTDLGDEPDFVSDLEQEIFAEEKAEELRSTSSQSPATPPPAATKPAMDYDAIMQMRREQAKASAPSAVGPMRRGVHLDVIEVLETGVLFGFDADALRKPAFRASMPMFCLGCSKSDTLIARPVHWPDQITDPNISRERINEICQAQVPQDISPREMLARMKDIPSASEPFDRAMPFYVCATCAPQATIHSHTFPDAQGLRCEVMIPSNDYALHWLGRVNGVCGDDYTALESALADSKKAKYSEAWEAIPEKTQQRIEAWYTPQPREIFVAYIKDSDYPMSDAGLGGIVLTDLRMIFCKYHQHGTFRHTDNQTVIHVRKEGSFEQLHFERDGTKRNIVRFRPPDTDLLIQTLADLDSEIQVVR